MLRRSADARRATENGAEVQVCTSQHEVEPSRACAGVPWDRILLDAARGPRDSVTEGLWGALVRAALVAKVRIAAAGVA